MILFRIDYVIGPSIKPWPEDHHRNRFYVARTYLLSKKQSFAQFILKSLLECEYFFGE